MRTRLAACTLALACIACAARAQSTAQPIRPPTVGEMREFLKDKPSDAPMDFSAYQSVETAGGQGSGGSATGPESAKFEVKNTTPPNAALPGGASASGGTGSAIASALGGSGWSSPMFWIGILLVLAGIALWIIPKISPTILPTPVPAIIPLGLVGAGAALITAALAPGLFVLCIIAAIVLLAGPKIVAAFQASHKTAQTQRAAAGDVDLIDQANAKIKALQSGLAAMVSGVALLPPSIKPAVQNAIAAQADPTTGDRATIHAAAQAQSVDLHIPENPTPPTT
jgi:hypothetical protein